ncbi:hypothetical protein PRIPAC_85274 [Pristionchus pacificus]|uniref:ubiquitinyl hydrolase 1 n=1 Tax=Pristionchus pacificus TaxID=54126 RepID=A0A2A6BMK0_PRIPA|nr:hypothetical protein PRIPAC_85274 [Pristionchus pacificus]|eukprot:PDM67130.1 Peptidase [Pristionchus pacificus]
MSPDVGTSCAKNSDTQSFFGYWIDDFALILDFLNPLIQSDMSGVHFKFAYRAKNHRFAPTLRDEEMLREIKDRVAKIVNGNSDYALCWIEKDHKLSSNLLHPLETTDDLREAVEHAGKATEKSASQPPCVHLSLETSMAPGQSASIAQSSSVSSTLSRRVTAQLAHAEHFKEFPKRDLTRNYGPRKSRIDIYKRSSPIPIPPRSPEIIESECIYEPRDYGIEDELRSEEEQSNFVKRHSTPPPNRSLYEPLSNCFSTRDLLSEDEHSHKENRFGQKNALSESYVQAKEVLTRSLRFGHSAHLPSPPASPSPQRWRHDNPYTDSLRNIYSSLHSPRRDDSDPFTDSLRSRYSSLRSSRRDDSDVSLFTNRFRMLNVPESSTAETDEGIGELGEEFRPRWLLLQNGGNDCFLNAALQYMRRARCLGKALGEREQPEEMDEKRERKERVLNMLTCLMEKEGRVHPRKFRQALPSGNERSQAGAIHYQHIERRNQIVDLEQLLSFEWTAVEGQTEPRHCSDCCLCCERNRENKKHDEDKCRACKLYKRDYVEEQRFSFKGDSSYALVAFNILHPGERMDWALSQNCNMDGMKMMDHHWRAVSIIKHSGSAYMNYSRGHYVTYTRQDDEKWYLHDDDDVPSTIGERYRTASSPPYAPGITDMQGVLAILIMAGVIRSKLGSIKKKTRDAVHAALARFFKLMSKAISFTRSRSATPPSTPPLLSRQVRTAPRRMHRSPLKIFNSTRIPKTSPRKFRRLFEPISPSKLRSPELVPALRHTPESEDSTEKKVEEDPWLLLENTGNDCFLNAALQYLRRARNLNVLLSNRRVPLVQSDEQERKESVLKMLSELLWRGGRANPRSFREALPTVIRNLEPTFAESQQDAYEILTKMFEDLIPEEVAKQFYIECSRRRRCRNVANCKGSEKVDSGAIHYQHIGRKNQVIDLESLLSDQWTRVVGENELRHCSTCCQCCQAAASGHTEDDCRVCKEDKRPYVEEQRFRLQGTSSYALIAFNILHETERMDWALSDNCDMDEMTLMGHQWRAVALIKHIGIARTYLSHYVAYTREDDGQWWLHDDNQHPVSIGSRYCVRSGHRYPHRSTDMQGVMAILFENISFSGGFLIREYSLFSNKSFLRSRRSGV